MMRTFALILALPLVAHAGTGKPIGFTKDGAAFLIGEQLALGGQNEEPCVAHEVHLQDIVKNSERTLLERYEGPGCAKIRLAPRDDEAQVLQVFLAAHPLVPLSGPKQGKFEATVTITNGTGAWQEDAYHYTATGGADGVEPSLELAVRSADGRRWSFGTVNVWARKAGATGIVRPFWSADSRYVAWVLTRDRQKSGAEVEKIVKGPLFGPRIDLLRDAKVTEPAAMLVGDALRVAGYAPLHAGTAKDRHVASGIFAAKGFEAVARELADLVPGGATVDKLSWKADFDIIVVVATDIWDERGMVRPAKRPPR